MAALSLSEHLSDAELLRRVYPQVLARALAFTKNLPEAEDAAQEAVLRALSTWPERGRPNAPERWLVTVATNAHRDRLRKAKWETPAQDALEALAEMSPWARIAVGDAAVARGWKDELLRLIFACCHPSLESGESAALALSTIVGFSNREIALAFAASPKTIEQRLTRARRRLRDHGDPEGTTPERSRDRVDAVLRTVHLLFNEGYWSSDDGSPIRTELCRLALGLAHSLHEAFPDEAEVTGLLALLLLHDARREARLDANQAAVPLPEQDRSRWDRQAIGQGEQLLAEAHSLGDPGPFQLEASISAVHCRAKTAEDTDWKAIADCYAGLESLRPTPAVRVNRAFAVARAEGAEAGLSLLDAAAKAASYGYASLVRGTLLAELGRREEARTALMQAKDQARNRAERDQIEARIQALKGEKP